MKYLLNEPIQQTPTVKLRSKSTVETFYMPIYVVTSICAFIFFIGPILVRNGQHQGLIRCCIMLTTFSLWLFWVTMYIAQMNPLVGPRMHNTSLAWVGYCWGEDPKKIKSPS